MTILSIVASQLIMMNNAYALSDSKAFTLKAESKMTSCGLHPIRTEGVIGDKFTYFVQQNIENNLDAYVNITHWEVGDDKITPEHAYLEEIAYKFGDYGVQVPFDKRKANGVKMSFSLKLRDGITLPDTVKDTQLTMTLTCFDEFTKEYHDAQEFYTRYSDEPDMEDYNKGLRYEKASGIIKPPYLSKK